MDKKRKINNSKRKQQVKRQLYFMAAAVICIGIISTVFIIRSKKEEAKERFGDNIINNYCRLVLNRQMYIGMMILWNGAVMDA